MAGLTAYYAAALYELAGEHGTLGGCLAQAAALRDALLAGKGCGTMEHPHISGANKRAFLDTIMPEDAHEDLIGFLHLLIAERHANLIVPALTAFVDKGRHWDEKVKVTAHVVSAAQLTADRAAELERMLAKRLNKRVTLSLEVDPSLIGGLRVYVSGLVIDHTVKKRLGDLRDTIKRGGTV